MKPATATPLHIVESYFDVELDRSALKRFDRVAEDEWVAFAKHYLRVMEAGFADEFLSVPGDKAPLRLYFEPRMTHAWDAAVRTLHGPTPMLGVRSDPGAGEITRDDVSRMLAPLKKHLLLADSVYICDNFYYSFDWVADSAHPDRWRQNPNTEALVRDSIRKLKAWLPILAELRQLIESRALVFMPYYLTPSFPFGGSSAALRSSMKKLRMRDRPRTAPQPTAPPVVDFNLLEHAPPVDQTIPVLGEGHFSEDDVLGGWLNARLLGLDPVFPTRAMFDWAAGLYFEEDLVANELTSDLISLDIVPFGGAEGIGLNDLVTLRKNEAVFDEIRRAVVSCKTYLETQLGDGFSQEAVTKLCESHLHASLDDVERGSLVRFVDDDPTAGLVVSIAIGAALLPVAPVIGVLAGAVLNPKLVRLVQRRFDPKRRAIGHLQALL